MKNQNMTFTLSGIRTSLFGLLSLSIFLLSSCKKTEVEEFAPPAPVPVAIQNDDYVPVYPDADAVMVSIKNISYDNQGGNLYEKSVGTARALFPSKNGSLVNAGDVSVENQPLDNDASNQYKYQPTALAPEGIPYATNKVRWSVSGNSNIPNINFINTNGFPEISPIAGEAEIIDRSVDFTLGLTDQVINADSVRYTVISTNGFIFITGVASNNSTTFSTSKLMLLAKGEGLVKIVAFRTISMEINEKRIKTINETTVTKKVTLL